MHISIYMCIYVYIYLSHVSITCSFPVMYLSIKSCVIMSFDSYTLAVITCTISACSRIRVYTYIPSNTNVWACPPSLDSESSDLIQSMNMLMSLDINVGTFPLPLSPSGITETLILENQKFLFLSLPSPKSIPSTSSSSPKIPEKSYKIPCTLLYPFLEKYGEVFIENPE